MNEIRFTPEQIRDIHAESEGAIAEVCIPESDEYQIVCCSVAALLVYYPALYSVLDTLLGFFQFAYYLGIKHQKKKQVLIAMLNASEEGDNDN